MASRVARTVVAGVLLLVACSAPAATRTPTAGPTASAFLAGPSAGAGGLVVMAVGDIACDPADPNFKAGIGTPTSCRQADTARLAAGANLLLLLGDNQYECGGLAAYRDSFNLSWGPYLARIRPALGNHEHNALGGPRQPATNCDTTRQAAGYFSYFGSDAPTAAYSFDANGWHLATVDSTCGQASVKCAAEAVWLRKDLAAHPAACTIVFYHHPRWSSGGHGDILTSDPFWRVAAAAGVDIILNGHDHDYERFAPMDANGVASDTGIREFVVGTGGRNHTAFRSIQPNSLVRNSKTFGVLELTLKAGSYSWKFLPITGQTFTDQGTGTCH